MADELSHTSQGQPQIPHSIPTRVQNSNKYIWLIIGVVITSLCCFCLCSMLCITVFGLNMYKVYTEKAPVEAVLDAYMQHMARKEAERAYALFSPRAQRQMPISKLQELLEGNNYIIYEGYQSLSVTNLSISATANINPDVPQGMVAKVTGVVYYDGNIQGTFNGVLEKVDGEWMIDGMYVTVPPSKIK